MGKFDGRANSQMSTAAASMWCESGHAFVNRTTPSQRGNKRYHDARNTVATLRCSSFGKCASKKRTTGICRQVRCRGDTGSLRPA
ncbi:hypothetical protein IMCC20628_00187 [Hoeflea sp. IMCC20628]|nr:hypothetical protein IMCC20628_00187 [Hoeflea sp. IMCC20628]